jgi:hypothetical protein
MEAANIADEILVNPPVQGFLTISKALQWRLQYTKVIDLAGQEDGLIDIYIAFPSVMRYAHLNSLFPVPYSLKPETLCLTIVRIAIKRISNASFSGQN